MSSRDVGLVTTVICEGWQAEKNEENLVNDDQTSLGDRVRLGQSSALVVIGVPVFLALVAATIVQLPVVSQVGETVVSSVSFALALLITTIAGVYEGDLQNPVLKRVWHGIGDGILGGFFFMLAYPGLSELFEFLGISRWMSFVW